MPEHFVADCLTMLHNALEFHADGSQSSQDAKLMLDVFNDAVASELADVDLSLGADALRAVAPPEVVSQRTKKPKVTLCSRAASVHVSKHIGAVGRWGPLVIGAELACLNTCLHACLHMCLHTCRYVCLNTGAQAAGPSRRRRRAR